MKRKDTNLLVIMKYVRFIQLVSIELINLRLFSFIANTATVGRRYSFDSLKNIILDVWLLSETDYLVCTFSSQVCRLAYELMQSRVVRST